MFGVYISVALSLGPPLLSMCGIYCMLAADSSDVCRRLSQLDKSKVM